MRNSRTAKAALLVIATAISFSSPATLANEKHLSDPACDQLLEDAAFTCQILTDGVGLVHDKSDSGVEHAKSVARRLCKLWSRLATEECARGLAKPSK